MDNYNNEFLDKVAIVTGAGQGMGKAVATRLAQSGSKIVVFDINQEQANSAVNSLNELKCESLVVTGDVTQKKMWMERYLLQLMNLEKLTFLLTMPEYFALLR